MSAVQSNLKNYAKFINFLRSFLEGRGLTEVYTPHIVAYENPDPHVQAIKVDSGYLHTSPEFAMKSLLSQGAGDIFQLCHVWRKEEKGQWHRSEFMMLEWYRLGWTLEDLIQEVIELVAKTGEFIVNRVTYADLFKKFLGINLIEYSREQMIEILGLEKTCEWSVDVLLDYAISSKIEPHLKGLWVIEEYPSSQAALAKLKPDNQSIALRFEIILNGVEIANGFDELNCGKKQRLRFIDQNRLRKIMKLNAMPLDEIWLSDLDKVPDCCGVALGVDRLYALSNSKNNIENWFY